MRKRIFLDMDGVIVDFDRYMLENNMTPQEVKQHPEAYAKMPPIPGAISGVNWVFGRFDTWLATKPPTGFPAGYAGKVQWVLDYLPALKRRIIMIADKSLLIGDILVDDRPERANAKDFKGRLIVFGQDVEGWDELIEVLQEEL